MATSHVNQLPLKHKIVIRSNEYKVEAPLPDNISLGAGGEVSAPFSGFASEGTAASLISLYAGASQKTGILTKKLWMGPDQPDVSFTLQFEAYYSAFDEVVAPCYALLLMSTGNKEKLLDQAPKLKEKIQAATGTILNKQQTERLTSLISFLRAPDNVWVLVGEYLRLYDCIVSNATVTFSNVLDSAGNPMSAEASITLSPAEPFTQSSIDRMFSTSKSRP